MPHPSPRPEPFRPAPPIPNPYMWFVGEMVRVPRPEGVESGVIQEVLPGGMVLVLLESGTVLTVSGAILERA